ncbi:RidA family protein [Hydrogenophilus hirschii]
MKRTIHTANAPAAIGAYSQAVQAGDFLYISGQLGLDPATKALEEGFEAQCHRMFQNLKAIAEAAGAGLDRAVKLTIYLTDLADFAQLNTIMAHYVPEPFPARAAVQVAALPKGGLVEADAILYLGQ